MKDTLRRLKQFVSQYKLFVLAAVVVLAGLGLELSGHKQAAKWLLEAVAIAELLPLLAGMWQDIRHGTYGIDILAATAIVASVLLGQYWAAIVVVLMLTGGESLEDFAEHRARTELDALLKRAPLTAHVLRKGKTFDVTVDEVHAGDKLIIRAGEVVPVDAIIVEGVANFDESSLTGESLPQAKEAGNQLLSGSVDLDGPVTAKATATAEDSQYQQIIRLVRSAAASQAPFVRLADRYSVPFTIMAYAIASAVWVISGHAIRFLEVIIVATPCPLLLAAPIALMSGMARMSRYGIIVKTGSALERLAETHAIAFDKTGTLTRGEPSVQTVKAYGSHSPEDVLALTASLEQHSNHVLARAVVTDAQLKKVKLLKAKHIQEVAGYGLTGIVKGHTVVAGRLSLLEQQAIKLPARFKAASQQTAVFVGVNGHLAAVITFVDEVRPEAAATLRRLQELDIRETIMVTGDNKAAALAIAKQLGISHVHADSLPADKLHILAEAKHRPLAFVGDGVNDAPILTAADVGIALGARGSTAASESADMVIMSDDLSRLAAAVEIAKRTFTIANQSILSGIGLSLGLMAVFATGHFSPLAGALLQEVVDVVVIFNALRAHLISPQPLTNPQ